VVTYQGKTYKCAQMLQLTRVQTGDLSSADVGDDTA